MQHPFVVWIAALLGLSQCEGILPEDLEADHATAADLVGTWMEVRTTYTTTLSGPQWVSTRRKTIIIDQVEGEIRFHDCVAGSSVTATMHGDKVTLSGGDYPVLALNEADTLSSTTTTGDTVVTLYRESDSLSPVVAQLSLVQPYELSDWSLLCLDTLVAAEGDNQVQFKVESTELGLNIGMAFTFATLVEPVTYTFPDPDGLSAATGTFAFGTESGTLTAQSGTVVVSATGTLDFQADLDMLYSATNDTFLINALLETNPKWFAQE